MYCLVQNELRAANASWRFHSVRFILATWRNNFLKILSLCKIIFSARDWFLHQDLQLRFNHLKEIWRHSLLPDLRLQTIPVSESRASSEQHLNAAASTLSPALSSVDYPVRPKVEGSKLGMQAPQYQSDLSERCSHICHAFHNKTSTEG
jgi:hypothetical protein